MGPNPFKFREVVLQFLFSIDMGNDCDEELSSCLMHELKFARKPMREACQRARSIWNARDQLDQIIAKESRDYTFERIQPVEKNVLRLALFDLLIEKEMGCKIVISEAIRLTRKFSTPEAGAFVNAILDPYLPKEDDGEQPTVPPQDTPASI